MITLLVLFSLFLLVTIATNVIFSLVVFKQDRRLKYFSNIGWISQSVLIFLIMAVCCLLATGGSTSTDLCKILDEIDTEEGILEYEGFIPSAIAPHLKECFFGEQQSLKKSLGLESLFDNVVSLKASMTEYNGLPKAYSTPYLTAYISETAALADTPGQLTFV